MGGVKVERVLVLRCQAERVFFCRVLTLPPRYYGPGTTPLGREVGAVMVSSSKHLAKEHCEAVWTDLYLE